MDTKENEGELRFLNTITTSIVMLGAIKPHTDKNKDASEAFDSAMMIVVEHARLLIDHYNLTYDGVIAVWDELKGSADDKGSCCCFCSHGIHETAESLIRFDDIYVYREVQ